MIVVENLHKHFGGFHAVDGASLEIKTGSITGLIGPNGAGKTTVFNLLTKFLTPTSGTIRFNGRDITAAKPAEIARMGVIRSFQISAVFPHMTARENVRVALQRKVGTSFQFWRSVKTLNRLNERADELLDMVGLSRFADAMVADMSYGRKRALEIATTLATEPEMMLLDEPTQGMGREDVELVTQLIRKVSAGRTILMVEHNLGVVSTLCDTITVLQRGAILTEGNYAEVSADPRVKEAYMGKAA